MSTIKFRVKITMYVLFSNNTNQLFILSLL